MMGTAPSLEFNCEQATRLQGYLQTYRRYAFTSLMPCTERNRTLRSLQTMQSKLIALLDQPATRLPFVLTHEEMTTLPAIISTLLVLCARRPACPERDATLVDLAALKAKIEHSQA